jgi:hypothetical protein
MHGALQGCFPSTREVILFKVTPSRIRSKPYFTAYFRHVRLKIPPANGREGYAARGTRISLPAIVKLIATSIPPSDFPPLPSYVSGLMPAEESQSLDHFSVYASYATLVSSLECVFTGGRASRRKSGKISGKYTSRLTATGWRSGSRISKRTRCKFPCCNLVPHLIRFYDLLLLLCADWRKRLRVLFISRDPAGAVNGTFAEPRKASPRAISISRLLISLQFPAPLSYRERVKRDKINEIKGSLGRRFIPRRFVSIASEMMVLAGGIECASVFYFRRSNFSTRVSPANDPRDELR